MWTEEFGTDFKRKAFNEAYEIFQDRDIQKFDNFMVLISKGYSNPQKLEESTKKDVHTLQDKFQVLESRMNRLEFQIFFEANKEKIIKIEEFVKNNFQSIAEIINVFYRPIKKGVSLILIHNFDNDVIATHKIHDELFKIEDAFPGIYFEPRIIHESELRPEFIKNSKLIYSKN